MLQAIRNQVQGWLAAVIVTALAIPFAFWGINYYFDQGAEAIAIRVNDREITLREYQRAYQTMRQQWNRIRGDATIPNEEELIRQRTVDGLIERELLRQFDSEVGLRVSDEQVRNTIESFEIFQAGGSFAPQLYETNLSNLGYTPKGFEARIRQDMMADQVQGGLTMTSFITETEIKRLGVLNAQTRDLFYAVLPSDEAKDRIEVTDADVAAYYERESRRFMEPEKVKISYIQLSLERIAEDVAVAEGELRSHYESIRATLGADEQREVSQFVIPLPEDAGPDQLEAARAKADELLVKLNGGTAMSDIVEQEKDSTDMLIEYSEFGFLTREILEPEVEEVAFSLEADSYGGPVRSKFGLHIIHVGEIRAPTIPSFEEAREQVSEDFRMQEAQRRYFELADRLATLTFEHPDTLELAADDLELTVQQSDFFSRGQAGGDIIGDPKVVSAAFSEDVLQGGNNSELIELDDRRAVVLRVSEHEPEHRKPLEEVRERIKTRIRFERAREAVRAKGQEMIGKLRAGSDRETLAAEYGIEWEQAPGVRRDDPKVNRAVLRTAFGAGRPDAGGALYDGVSLGSGDYAVVAVTGVADPDPDSLTDDELKAVRDQIRDTMANETWTRFVNTLRSRAEIQVLTDNL